MRNEINIDKIDTYELSIGNIVISIDEAPKEMVNDIFREPITDTYSTTTESDRVRQYFRIHESNGDVHCDLDKLISGSYHIGFPIAGDKMVKMGCKAPSKVFSILRDRGVSKEDRTIIPVIGNGNNIVLIPGYLVGSELMVTRETNRIGLIRYEK